MIRTPLFIPSTESRKQDSQERSNTMKAYRKIIIASHLVLLLGFAIGVQQSDAASDPRFYGEYFGTYSESYTIRIRVWFFGWHTISEKHKTISFDVSARADYEETREGQGIVLGGGSAVSSDETIRFGFNAFVTSRGRIKGTGMASGMGDILANGRLSDDGRELTLRAMDRTIVLRKDARGNRPPGIRIASPESGSHTPYGDPQIFRAEVTDPEDGTVDPSRIIWSTDRDGVLGTGSLLRAVVLSPGSHHVSVSATDSGGLSSGRIRPIFVTNDAPNPPQIQQPITGESFEAGQHIVFRGRASDPEDGVLRGDSLSWRSSISGEIGSGQLLSDSLGVGRHTITLRATDSSDLSRSTSVGIEVVAAPPGNNYAPSIRIVTPSHFDAVAQYDSIVFRATANDREDGSLPSESIVWSDRYIGATGEDIRELGRGATITVSDLFSQPELDVPHTITVTATDSGDRSVSDEITIYVISDSGLY